jgi:hypothetical protein
MRVLALDLSIKSTGWALWDETQERPAHGAWKLGEGLEWRARAFCRLQRQMMDLHRLGHIDRVFYEQPLNPALLNRANNPAVPAALIGLAMHVESFCEATAIRCIDVHQATWRRHWLGKMPRGTKSANLKSMSLERCRMLGWKPATGDAAEALGLLDFGLHHGGVKTPWQDASVFTRAQL